MEHAIKIIDESSDFTALYLGVKNLKSFICENTSFEDNKYDLSDKLFKLLKSRNHESQTRSFFLYREICDLIIFMVNNSTDEVFKRESVKKLEKRVIKSKNDKLRALGDSISGLKIVIQPQSLFFPEYSIDHSISIDELIVDKRLEGGAWYGRSLIFNMGEESERLLVLKFLRGNDDASGLSNEIFWMEKLNEYENSFFSVPKPLFKGIVKVKSSKTGFRDKIPDGGKAIVFIATKDYYRYPNEKNNGYGEEKFLELMGKTAYLTGFLSGIGIVHNALIPLFHNTVQKDRREDGGLYMWEKGGRLDDWLGSCKYPNFGFSGLRDFEHIEFFTGDTGSLYRNIGNQILSFVLVAGSFFRNVGCDKKIDSKKVGKKGFYGDKFFDATDLFDRKAFSDILNNTLSEYLKGFTGIEMIDFSFDDTLVEKLIEAMGCDKNMEEVIRVRDQKNMEDDEYIKLLESRNIDPDEAPERGVRDLKVRSGPHLGNFNSKISVPELTEFVIKAASVSILNKYAVKI